MREYLIILCYAVSMFSTFPLFADVFGKIYRLENKLVSVDIAPDIGRIISYSLKNSSNVLWVNDFNTPGVVNYYRGWTNYGGDKVWCAPQNEWSKYQGASWPPDISIDGSRWTVLNSGTGRLVMRSPVSSVYKVQITRIIELSETSSALRITNSFRQTSSHPGPIAIWTVTQAPLAKLILVGRKDGKPISEAQNMNKSLPDVLPSAFRRFANGSIISYDYSSAERSNLRFSCDWLAIADGDSLLIESYTASAGVEGEVSGIVYTAPKENYMELEFQSPEAPMKEADVKTMSITWQLLPYYNDPSEKLLAKICEALQTVNDEFKSSPLSEWSP